MKRLASFVLALAAFAPFGAAQATWVPDKAHSSVDFSILHMSLSKVHGHFGNITGTVVWNDGDITKSSVNVTIDATTIDTGVSARDNDLKSANFFDVAQYPTATFVSTNIARNGKNLTVSGNLTVHGITKPVVLQVEGPVGPVQGTGNKMHAGFSATTTLSRSAF
ncbi:MAG TPA: YceI family protein, partial [Acidobacteriaceae bacterium]|nr:YceI family protein [Acidobacteriaceae bacterium]